MFTQWLSSSESKKIWEYHRLDLHRKVLDTKIAKANCRVLAAKLLAAKGMARYDEYKALKRRIIRYRCRKKYYLYLAKHLLNFDCPFVTYLKKRYRLSFAYYCKKGRSGISKTYVAKNYRKYPEILLWYSNISLKDKRKKIRFLNLYLKQFGLAPFRLNRKGDRFNFLSLLSSGSYTPTRIIDESTKISVVMTAYNAEKYIDYAVESVLRQTYKNFELIVVDDGSEDRTSEIIAEYEKRDGRVKSVRLTQNVGTYKAKNIVLRRYVSGDVVTFHDSDDISHPQKLQLQLEALRQGDTVATVSYWVRMDASGNYFAHRGFPLLRMNLSSLMLKRHVVEKAGVFQEVQTGADSEYFSRIEHIFGKERLKKIKKPLSLGLHRHDSLMNHRKTGYNEAGYSRQRLEYLERWRLAHMRGEIEVLQKEDE